MTKIYYFGNKVTFQEKNIDIELLVVFHATRIIIEFTMSSSIYIE